MNLGPHHPNTSIPRWVSLVLAPVVAMARFIHRGVTLNAQDDAWWVGLLVVVSLLALDLLLSR